MRYHLLPAFFAILATGANAQQPPDTLLFAHVDKEAVVSPAEMRQPDRWSYSDCVDWAIAHNVDLRKVLLQILQADQNVGQAKDAWLPTVGFNTSQGYVNYPAPAPGGNSNAYTSSYGINAQWTVWEGNMRKYRLESAELLARQQRLTGEDQIKTIRLAVLSAYLRILYAREAIDIAAQSLEVSASQTERTRRLMETGRTSKVDFSQIESQQAQDEYNLTQARNNYATSKLELKRLLQLGIDSDFELVETPVTEAEVLMPLPEAKSVYDYAASWLPAFRSNDLNRAILANDVSIARAGYLPEISLQGGIGTGYNTGGSGWGTQMKQGLHENLGLSLSVPIYDGNATRRAVAKAKLAELEYELDRENLLNDLSQTLESLYIDAGNARSRYEAALKQLEANSLTAQLVDRQFDLGLVNPLDLLTAHNNLLNSRLELLQSKYLALLANKSILFYATRAITLDGDPSAK